ncbi:MAG: hypothetical protein JO121_03830 [Deltaproteobacteria bacterium]|nr:hypothetical protein [Deltaproteobacteria bacterium]
MSDARGGWVKRTRGVRDVHAALHAPMFFWTRIYTRAAGRRMPRIIRWCGAERKPGVSQMMNELLPCLVCTAD